MANTVGKIDIIIKVHLSLWDAIKLRIAGAGAPNIDETSEKAEEEDIETARIEHEGGNTNT